jgi:hypothetical protein
MPRKKKPQEPKEPKPQRAGFYAQRVDEAPEVNVVLNKDGILEGINSKGEVVWTEKANQAKHAVKMRENRAKRHSLASRQHFIENDAGEKVLVPWHITAGKLRNLAYPYTEAIGIAFCARLAEGDTAKNICSDEHFPPYYIVNYWRARHPEFKRMYEEAKRSRAEMFHDHIVDIAEEVDEDNAKSAKVKIDAYKHLAAVGNPDEYGSKTKISGDPTAPLSFIFNTGIDRSPPKEEPEEAIPVESKEVEDDGEGEDWA